MSVRICRILFRGVAAGLALVPFALAWQSESDPRRFLKVQDWTLTATFTAEQVRDEEGLYQTHSAVSHSFTARAHITEKQGASGLGQRWRAAPSVLSAQGGVRDVCSLKGGEDSHLITTAGSGATKRGRAEFSLDLTSGEYWVHVSFGRMSLHSEQKDWTKDGETADNAFDVEGDMPGFRVDGQKLPQTGLVIEGSTVLPDYEFPFAPPCAQLKVDAKVTWRIAPGDEEDSELEITVEGGDDGYLKWQPKGSLDPASPGKQMSIVAELRSASGGSPKLKAREIKLELINTSKEPGVAINFPAKGAGTGFDLKFDPDQVDGPNPRQENEEQTLTYDIKNEKGEQTAPLMTKVSAVINCYDWGAWSTLKITAELETGKSVTGYLKGHKDQKTIRLPKRAEDSKIADSWKTDKGVAGQSDNGDDETKPPGDAACAGDGLTLYEEYRGFYEAGEHKFGNLEKKDFFIRNKASEDAKPGIELCKTASELEVHSEFKDDEFPESRVINPNASGQSKAEGRHIVDQHGVVLEKWDKDYSQAGDEGTTPGTPKSIPAIHISGANLKQKGTFLDAEIAHELMHACNVWHHGEGDIEDVKWKKKLDKDQIYEVSEGAETPVTVYNQDGRRLSASELAGGSITVWVGIEHGQHSGAEDCLLRYHKQFAAYRSAGNVRHLTQGGMIGKALCNDPPGRGGTGINADGKAWGDATPGRGGCSKQICINDAVAARKR